MDQPSLLEASLIAAPLAAIAARILAITFSRSLPTFSNAAFAVSVANSIGT